MTSCWLIEYCWMVQCIQVNQTSHRGKRSTTWFSKLQPWVVDPLWRLVSWATHSESFSDSSPEDCALLTCKCRRLVAEPQRTTRCYENRRACSVFSSARRNTDCASKQPSLNALRIMQMLSLKQCWATMIYLVASTVVNWNEDLCIFFSNMLPKLGSRWSATWRNMIQDWTE